MPAAATAAISTGYMIKFRKYAVYIFFVVVNTLNQLTPRAGKGYSF